jgi:hypothetical protein
MLSRKELILIAVVMVILFSTILMANNSRPTDTSYKVGFFSGSDDPGVIYDETRQVMLNGARVELKKIAKSNGRPGWVDITETDTFEESLNEECEKISEIVIKLRQQGILFDDLGGNKLFCDAMFKAGENMGKTIKGIWRERDAAEGKEL